MTRRPFELEEGTWVKITMRGIIAIIVTTSLFVAAYTTIRMELSDNQNTLVSHGRQLAMISDKVDTDRGILRDVQAELKAQRSLLEYIAGGRRGSPPISLGTN